MKVEIGFTDSYTKPIFESAKIVGKIHQVYDSELPQILSNSEYLCVGDYIVTDIKYSGGSDYPPKLTIEPYYKTFFKNNPPYKDTSRNRY